MKPTKDLSADRQDKGTYRTKQYIPSDISEKEQKTDISTKDKCKHSWMQDAPEKVCYHCGLKPFIKCFQDPTCEIDVKLSKKLRKYIHMKEEVSSA